MTTIPFIPTLHNRHRAIAELDRLIEGAELAQARHRIELDRIVADGQETRRATEFLTLASTHLAQLHRSRETLVGGETARR